MYDFLDKIGLKAVLEAIKGKMPTSLPANGGNADYATNAGNADTVDNVHISCTNDAIPNSNWFAAFTNENNLRAIDPGRAYVGNAGNADTLDGLHADDFVKSFDQQFDLPSNVDVPTWISQNANYYTRYRTHAGIAGLTNVPDNSTDYVWYWYDGLNILARDNSSGKYYICDTVNGVFSGWKDIYTSRYKPYVTGEVSVSYSTESQNFEFLNFTPSAVICKYASRYENDGTIKWATPITNGFKVTINSADAKTLEFIAFR